MAGASNTEEVERQAVRDTNPAVGLLCGEPLRNALGFSSAEAFRTAVHSGRLPVPVFKIPGRQGWFARSTDVASWLRTLDDIAERQAKRPADRDD